MKIYSPSITGSTGILGSLTVTGGVTASLEGTASFAITASHALNSGGQPGLVSGSSPNSMRNANFLVTTPATASGTSSIAIGNNARSFADYSIIIGDSAQNYDSARPNSIYIGRNASGAQNSIGIGWGATALSDSTVVLGRDATANANNSVAIGWNAVANDGGASTTGSVAIGYNTRTQHFNEVNINNRFYFNSGSSGQIELRANTLVSGSITARGSLNATGSVNLLSGSFSGSVIDNITDVYTTTPRAEHIITLTQAEYNAISSSADSNTLYYITDASSFVTSASFATTAATASYVLNAVSASFYSLAAVTQNAVFSGSVRGDVSSLLIGSNTASIDLSTGNFFDLTIVSGSNTFINFSNIAAGQTVNLRVIQPNPGNGTVSFPSSVKQVSGNTYVPTTGSGATDIVTFISFDNTSLYLSNVKNLV